MIKYLSSLKNKDLSGRICLLRIDLNVKNASNLRLIAVVPTIKFLIRKKAKVVILSHRGRPHKVQSSKLKVKNLREFSLRSFVNVIAKKIGQRVKFVSFQFPLEKFFSETAHAIHHAPEQSVFLLENLRFLKGEEENNNEFARRLASLGDFYVNEDFGVSHRLNASVAAITKFLPSYAGYLMEKEIANLSRVKERSRKPFVIILGGVKIAERIRLLTKFYHKADFFLIGGGIANSFFAMQGFPIGRSVYEKIKLDEELESGIGTKILLPIDNVITHNEILDVGEQTIERYGKIIQSAKTIIWNGPLGYSDVKRYRRGSEKIAEAVIKSGAYAVIGGGETTMIFEKMKPKKNIFLSTGGAAMLDFLAGERMPGIEALK